MLAQGVATKYLFLRRPCAQCLVAFVSRYEKGLDLHQLASRVSPELLPTTPVQVPVFGCWEPDDIVPDIGDEMSKKLILKHYLIFDDIPDPEQTEDENPEEFLRKAQRVARLGAGVALFGSSEWDQIRAIKNRSDVHFKVVKNLDRITITRDSGPRTHIDLPHRDSHNFQITITSE
jgi:hypothetical protein